MFVVVSVYRFSSSLSRCSSRTGETSTLLPAATTGRAFSTDHSSAAVNVPACDVGGDQTTAPDVGKSVVPTFILNMSSNFDEEKAQNCECGHNRNLIFSSLHELQQNAPHFYTDSFVPLPSQTYLTFITATDDLNPTIKVSVVIDSAFRAHINIYGKVLSEQHDLWRKLPAVFNTQLAVEQLLALVSKYNVCSAISDSALLNEVPAKYLSIANMESYCRLRSNTCSLLLPNGVLCRACQMIKKRISMLITRKTKSKVQSSANLIKDKKPNKFLTSPIKAKKLTLLARKNRGLQRAVNCLTAKVKTYESKCTKLIEMQGMQLNDNDSTALLHLTSECKDSALQLFPTGSFQEIFWRQQIKYNSLKNKASMRWHPSIIRWCLFIKSKSAKAYECLREYLSLPCNTTLYDYSHYMEHGIGVNPKTMEQLIVTARKLDCYSVEHRAYIGILHDEVKIKADLVYHKTTGDMLGYVKLDNITNELLNLEELVSVEKKVATSMLVVMVIGITSNLRYPLACYATKQLSSYCLYNIMWECVEYIETVAGLKVMYICCDGAVQNRKFFQIHSQGNEICYKTENPYAADSRDIYFISDAPHLLKTTRNCFANGHLWFNQEISWKDVVNLFENHCQKSEYQICPKLTKEHIYLTSFGKMRVSLAAQVLSATVGNALEHVYGPRTSSTVQFIRTMNKWFDIMNIKNCHEGRRTRNPNVNVFTNLNDPRLQWLECDFIKYLNEWQEAAEKRPGNFTPKQRKQMQLSSQTLLGLKITSQSVAEITRILLAAGAPFVLTCHMNQDPLEQLFGHTRHKGGANSNPSIAEACHAVNSIRTVSTQAIANRRGNTEPRPRQLDNTPVPKRRNKRAS